MRDQISTVRKLHGDALSALDDVIIGQDETVPLDDEAAARLRAQRRHSRHRLIVKWPGIGRCSPATSGIARAGGGFDVDDSRVDSLRNVCEVHEAGGLA